MLASFLAELLKLRKRPATWVLILIWVFAVAFFGYFTGYLSVSTAPPPEADEDIPPEVQEQIEAQNEAIAAVLYPENIFTNLFGNGFGFGVVIFGSLLLLVLGALAAGSEYGWGTMKTSLTQRPGRLAVLAGKALAFLVSVLVFAVLSVAVAALSSLLVAAIADYPVEWPSVGELARGTGAVALFFAVYGTMGFVLATFFRGTALAIGLGLGWVLAIENIVSTLPIDNDLFENVRRFFISENTFSISQSFGSTWPDIDQFGLPEDLVDPERAVITLLAYAAVFVLISVLFVWRRDMD